MIRHLKAHSSSLLSIGVRAASVIAGFMVTFYIGHSFGPLANGQYALIAQTAMFLSIVAVGGMDLAVVRYFSATQEYKVPLSRRSLYRALGYSLGTGAVIVSLLAATHTWILDFLFHSYMPQHGVVILGAILMVRTTTRLTAAVLRSQDRHFIAQVIEVLAIPVLVTVLLALGVVVTLAEVLYATAGVGMLTAVFGIWRSFRFTSGDPAALDVPFRALFRTSMPLWLNAIALNIADWYSLATAAAALGVYEAGLFRVAFQIGSALSFSAMGIYNVFTARISAALAVGDVARVARLSRSATRLSLVILIPIVIALFAGGEELLGLIGPAFRQAAPLLKLILVGQLLYVATGPAGLVLAMSGHERLNLLISAAVTGSLLILAPIAAHLGGLYGLAALVACVPFAGNVANMIVVYRLERINTVTGRYFGPPRAVPASAAT